MYAKFALYYNVLNCVKNLKLKTLLITPKIIILSYTHIFALKKINFKSILRLK